MKTDLSCSLVTVEIKRYNLTDKIKFLMKYLISLDKGEDITLKR